MKKLLGCFLCVMLLFASATPAAADLLTQDLSYIWDNPDNLPNTRIGLEQEWLNPLLTYPEPPSELLYEDDCDGWAPPSGWTYSVLKYGRGQPAPYGYDHWAIIYDGNGRLQPGFVGVDGTDNPYELDFHAQSHISYDAPIPEPATMVLLGSGLIGLAIFGRKNFKK